MAKRKTKKSAGPIAKGGGKRSRAKAKKTLAVTAKAGEPAGNVEKPSLKNRVIGTRRLLGREYNATGLNHRVLGKGQEAAIVASVETRGKADALLVYDSPKWGPNTLINGHKRAARWPEEEWTALVLDFNDAEALDYLKDYDELAAMSAVDDVLSEQLRAGIEREEEALAGMLAGQAAEDAALAAGLAGEGGAVGGNGAGGPAVAPAVIEKKPRRGREGEAGAGGRGVLTCAKAEDWLPTVADASAQLIIVDPPYFKVAEEEWDRQWKTPAEYLGWLGGLADEWERVLAPNGSLYVFASPLMAARVEVRVVAERFEVLNRIRWLKEEGWHKKQAKEELRSYLSPWEEIIFAERRGADSMALGESGYAAQCEELRGMVFEPLRAYLEKERKAAGISKDQINEACGFAKGGMAGHYFSRVQWQLPRAEHYETMRKLFNGHLRREYGHLRREYEDLRREYEDLRREYEDLRRPFFVNADSPHTDVWQYPTVETSADRHSCQKPLEMLRDLILASSRPGDVVLDCFAGSGTTWAAAIDTGREFKGCEGDFKWASKAEDRAARHWAALPGS